MTIKSWRQSSMVKEIRYENFAVGYPQTVQGVSAADGGTGTTATVSFTNQTGATLYTAISTPGSFTGTSTTGSPITVSGLTTGTAYTFRVAATNATGQGPYSSASNSVTPVAPSSFYSIATITATSGQTSLTFSSIPSTYKSLQLRWLAQTSNASYGTYQVRYQLNGDTGANYAWHSLTGINGSTYANSASSTTVLYQNVGQLPSTYAPGKGVAVVDLIDYANTSKYKTLKMISGVTTNGSNANDNIILYSGLWQSTAAVNSITILNSDANGFIGGSTFSLYGVS